MDAKLQSQVLIESLPYLRKFHGETVVIKYGGSALDAASTDTILEDAAALQSVGVRVILVHGGGKEISALLEKLNVESQFADGYRVTDEVTLQAAEMALSARVNKSIVAALDRIGAKACGLSGRDGGLITARQKDKALGLVGTITKVDPQVLRTLLDGGYLPVVSPIARSEEGGALNCNADDAACAVAEALKADKLVFLTDVDGLYENFENKDSLISNLTLFEAQYMVENNIVSTGMIPKLKSCIHALDSGVFRAHIINGITPHSLLLELLTSTCLLYTSDAADE